MQTVRVILGAPGHVVGYPDNPAAEAWLRVLSSRSRGRPLRSFSLAMLASMRDDLGVPLDVVSSGLTRDQLLLPISYGLVSRLRAGPSD